MYNSYDILIFNIKKKCYNFIIMKKTTHITKFFFVNENLINESKLERINKKAAILLEYRNFLSNEIFKNINNNKVFNTLKPFYLMEKYGRKIKNIDFFIKNDDYIKYISTKDLEININVVYSNYANKIDTIKNIEERKITKNKRNGKFKTLQCILRQENIYYKKTVRSKVDKHFIIHNKGDFKERKYNNI
jgi:hypothetical protein